MGLHFIESAANDTFKTACKLASSTQGLKKEGLAFAEGLHLFESLFAHSDRFDIQMLWVPQSLLDHEDFKAMNRGPRLQAIDWLVLPDRLYSKLTRVEKPTGPGVFFRVPEEATALNPNQDVVLLDGVQDPGNTGTLIRTAVAAGITQVVIADGGAWAWGDKVLRAAMGGHVAAHFFSTKTLLDTLEKKALPIRTTALQPNSASLFDCDLRAPGVWVFGSEGQGVSPFWLSRATECIRIPQSPLIESLNVAVSSAVCLYEQVRQRG
ncbi:RNA methyltransferase [Limnobacter sp.]|uniref:TrmH family RNA methyltransferase n=1 Tax=Limnobacter sp. TaxID=2003368 RepID=UPI0025875C19|nr:RNA methyltransferase [Limnobacter sp.]